MSCYLDLDLVRQVLGELRAPNLDVNRDVVKAIRKLPPKSTIDPSRPPLGTVLVETRNEASRSIIMKNK